MKCECLGLVELVKSKNNRHVFRLNCYHMHRFQTDFGF
jgi:hypothetical protein